MGEPFFMMNLMETLKGNVKLNRTPKDEKSATDYVSDFYRPDAKLLMVEVSFYCLATCRNSSPPPLQAGKLFFNADCYRRTL